MRRLFRQRRAKNQGDSSCNTPVFRRSPSTVNNTVGAGNRLVVRVVLLQVAGAALSALVFWWIGGANAACAAFAGGLIAAVGSALLGWRMFAPGIAPAGVLQRAMFAGEALKWSWYVLALWIALSRLKLAPLPLLIGLIVAQFAYWRGLIGQKRG
jgi:F0F1-type ATP synthase assembly protein I